LLALPASYASAETAPALSANEQAAVNSVAAKARTLPLTVSQAVADNDRAAIQPVVDAALATGGQKVARYLVDTSKDPNVVAAVINRYPPTRVEHTSGTSPFAAPAGMPGASIARAKHRYHVMRGGGVRARANPTHQLHAHSSGCWGNVWDQQEWYEAGAATAWIYDRVNGWCGNGSSITWYGGPTFSQWTWGVFCLNDGGKDFSWDRPWSWIHEGFWASYGISYAFGCGTYSSGHAVNRIAANGYYDHYDDYGV
jgi:hypothetical protein